MFLLEGLPLAEPTLMQVISHMEPVLVSGIVTNHRAAVLGLAEHRSGWTTHADGASITLGDGEESMLFEFDDADRVTPAKGSFS